jgi:hypothetical protein
MADVDPLNRRVVEQMLVGVATSWQTASLEARDLVRCHHPCVGTPVGHRQPRRRAQS